MYMPAFAADSEDSQEKPGKYLDKTGDSDKIISTQNLLFRRALP